MTNRRQFRQRTFGALALTSATVLSVCLYLAAAPAVTLPGAGLHSFAMAAEAMYHRLTVIELVCYVAAAVCFAMGVWGIWASRQPQNHESGDLVRGIAWFVLCGMYILAGVWLDQSCCNILIGPAEIDLSSTSIVTFR